MQSLILKMKTKRILIIATAFSPENEIGAIRVTKLVKYLIRQGFSITIFSPELHEGSKINNAPEPIEFKNIERHTIHLSENFQKFFLKKRNELTKNTSATNLISNKNSGFIASLKSSLMSIIQFLYSLLRGYDWYRQVLNSQQYKDSLNYEYDAIFSSYPSVAAHWVGVNASKVLKIPLITDFRDPMNYETNSNWFNLQVNSYLQRQIIRRADAVTTIANDLIPKLKDGNKYPNTQFVYLPNGYDIDDLEVSNVYESKQDYLTFCYVGSLYGGQRKLNSFFEALNEAIIKDLIPKNKIKVVYAGKEFGVLHRVAKKFNLTDILINKGFVSREESIDLQANSDLIIVVTWNTKKDQGIMTGKLYECMLTEKPVIVVVNGNVPNSEIKRVIKMVEGGFVIEDASLSYNKEKEELVQFIKEAYVMKSTRGSLPNFYNNKRDHFSYDNIVKKLGTLFKEL